MACPTKYTDKLVADLCRRLADGESLRRICEDPKMPTRATILNWVFDGNHPEFFGQYTRAREIQAELMAEEIVEIADDGANDIDGDKVDHENVQRSRLRVDARKWVAARLLPKRYGDRIQADVEHRGRVVFEMHFGGDG